VPQKQQPLDTVGILYGLLGKLLTEGTVNTGTKLFLASDEEGNQINRCWAWGLETPETTVWTQRSVAGQKRLDYKTETKEGAEEAFVLWPSHEQLHEEHFPK